MDKQADATATTYQIRLSENAIQNIDEITGYIAFINHQPMNVIKVGDAFFEAIGKIQQNPYAYKDASLSQQSQRCTVKNFVSAGTLFIKLLQCKLLYWVLFTHRESHLKLRR